MSEASAVTDGLFFCRLGVGFVLEIIAELFLIAAVARIYHIYGFLLTDSDAECALKAGFSMFTIALVIELCVIIFDLLMILAIVYTNAPCKCSCYLLKVLSHFAAVTCVILGTMIYGIKDPDKVGWGFWMAFGSIGFCLFNGLMFVCTEQMKQFLKDKGVNVSVLERGGRIG